MAMIFPGMDPYLEDPRIWQGFHNSLMVYLRDQLQPQVRPRYIAAVEERVYLEGPEPHDRVPDVWVMRSRSDAAMQSVAVLEESEPVVLEARGLEIHENYIEILDRESGLRVVTVIEVVSPSNKDPGSGRDSYIAKQREILHSTTHLVEIDLLRDGPHVLAVPRALVRRRRYHYLVSVNRAEQRSKFELYFRTVRRPLPRVRIPLAHGDPDVWLDLQAVVAHTYEAGAYRDRLNYGAPCEPPLAPDDEAWATELIRTTATP